jgi:hypothetical protein
LQTQKLKDTAKFKQELDLVGEEKIWDTGEKYQQRKGLRRIC